MAGKKGRSGGARRGAGRPRGSENKVNAEFRETVRLLLEENSGNVRAWLTDVANGRKGKVRGKKGLVYIVPPDPEAALHVLAKLAEFAAPKLNRTEHTGKDGKALLPAGIQILF
jgi:hypothetical protein